MNHRIALPLVCALAVFAAGCSKPAGDNSADGVQPPTQPAPMTDPTMDPATPSAVPIPEGTPGAMDPSMPGRDMSTTEGVDTTPPPATTPTR